jgi:hypothetical protein
MGITYVGKTYVRDLINGDSTNDLDYFAWGAGSLAFHDSDIALGSELFPSGGATARNQVYSIINLSAPLRTVLTGRLEPAQLIGGSIYEIGLFTDSSGGSLFCRKTFYKLIKTASLRLIDDFYIEVESI